MKFFKYLIPLSLAINLLACGGGGGGNGNPSSNATSVLCQGLTGLEAIYWDFINGTARTDLPDTAFTIPFQVDFSQSPYTNRNSVLLGFTSIPKGWVISDGMDVSGFAFPNSFAGADLVRADNRAVWRYIL
ncbi:MAG TPA: hypothetical protein ENJ84_09745, partial [Gammaproteobacteria bacterium]|nr:hypothetical protein [Gammaproteobacteria bacterium]